MDSTELYQHFRSQVDDVAQPYLWSDDEVWRYAGDAYRMFARLTGGIADFTSDATRITVTTGEPTGDVSRSILRIMTAHRMSDGFELSIINQTDLTTTVGARDYGRMLQRANVPLPGPVEYLLIGRQKGLAHFLAIPIADDEIQLSIYRLPLVVPTGEGQTLDEIDEEHHIHLVLWMKHLAYSKHDVETANEEKSAKFKRDFEVYCASAKAEWDRMKHKNRVVSYGGI